MVKQYLDNELIGHINGDSTDIVGHENTVGKVEGFQRLKEREVELRKEQNDHQEKKRRLEIQLDQSFEIIIW